MGRRTEARLSKRFVLEPVPPDPEIAGRTPLRCTCRLWAQLPVDPARLIQQFCGTPVVEVAELQAHRAEWRAGLERMLQGGEPPQRPWWHFQHKTAVERIVAIKPKRRRVQ
jgi:hypothetical protein